MSVFDDLRKPFAANEVEWKPQTVSGNRALAIAYIDARCVMDRLDKVVGPTGWQDEYDVMPDGNVVCRLRLKLADEWITKTDVGGESDQKDEGDRRKASFSDALKRAAVKWGIGRYLYSLPHQWVDYDPQKKQFVKRPTLPTWALPAKDQQAAKPEADPASATNGKAPTITKEQGAELKELIGKATKAGALADSKEFFFHFELTRLGELPADKFAEARQYLADLMTPVNK